MCTFASLRSSKTLVKASSTFFIQDTQHRGNWINHRVGEPTRPYCLWNLSVQRFNNVDSNVSKSAVRHHIFNESCKLKVYANFLSLFCQCDFSELSFTVSPLRLGQSCHVSDASILNWSASSPSAAICAGVLPSISLAFLSAPASSNTRVKSENFRWLDVLPFLPTVW